MTGKAPYKFESGFLQRRVRCELDPAPAREQIRRTEGLTRLRDEVLHVYAQENANGLTGPEIGHRRERGGRRLSYPRRLVHMFDRSLIGLWQDRETLWGGRRKNGNFVAALSRWSAAMPQPQDLEPTFSDVVTLDSPPLSIIRCR